MKAGNEMVAVLGCLSTSNRDRLNDLSQEELERLAQEAHVDVHKLIELTDGEPIGADEVDRVEQRLRARSQ